MSSCVSSRADIYFGARTRLIRQGKGKKDRVVPISRIAARLTQRYMHTKHGAAHATHVRFVDDMGNRVTVDAMVRYILAPAVRGAGAAAPRACEDLDPG